MDFDLIYQAYFKDAFLYMCSLSADENIAEEITQESFTKALKSLDSFDGKKIFGHGFLQLQRTHITPIASGKKYLESTNPTRNYLTRSPI